VRIAFDIGGVLSKFPDVFRPLFRRLALPPACITVLESEPIELFVISDMHDKDKMGMMLLQNGFDLRPSQIHCADYKAHGEDCKAVLCEQLGIDILIDDFPGYVCQIGSPRVRLLVMPDPSQPYYADEWKTDGSEGDFGRRNPPGSKRPPEDR